MFHFFPNVFWLRQAELALRLGLNKSGREQNDCHYIPTWNGNLRPHVGEHLITGDHLDATSKPAEPRDGLYRSEGSK
jgi:hypothetical protein